MSLGGCKKGVILNVKYSWKDTIYMSGSYVISNSLAIRTASLLLEAFIFL